MRESTREWGLALAITLLLHYAWEMVQAPWFDVFAGQAFWEHAWPCFRAALGDVLIAAGSYTVVAILFRRPRWAFKGSWIGPAIAWIAFGLVVTILFERWALAVGRWAYTASMPTIGGIGLAPLLQWIVVPAVALAILRSLTRPESS